MAFGQVIVDRLLTFIKVKMPMRLRLGNVLFEKLLVMLLLSREFTSMSIQRKRKGYCERQKHSQVFAGCPTWPFGNALPQHGDQNSTPSYPASHDTSGIVQTRQEAVRPNEKRLTLDTHIHYILR